MKTFQAMVVCTEELPLAYCVDCSSRKWSLIAAVCCAGIWLLLTGMAQQVYDF